MKIEPIHDRDYAAVADIYNYYIASTVVTFEEELIGAAEIAKRATAVADATLPWLVAWLEWVSNPPIWTENRRVPMVP